MEFIHTLSGHPVWRQHGVTIAWAVAALCLLVSISAITWQAYHAFKQKKHNYQPLQAQPLTQNVRKTYRIQEIVNANLFGDPNPKPIAKQAPKTTLNLTLDGILWASNPLLARAIISAQGKTSQLYSHGEDIKDASASVEEIRTNEVLLNRNGALESLPLVKRNDRPIIIYSSKTSDNAIRQNLGATIATNH